MQSTGKGNSDESDNELNTSPLYKDRPEWKDVSGIYNDVEEDAVVRINHNETCKLFKYIDLLLPLVSDAFAYFRATLHNNEMSERSFELTTTCAQLNPANYSVWFVI
jgi:hypothetical protein